MKKAMCTMLAVVLSVCLLSGCQTKTDKLKQIQEKGTITMVTSPDFAPSEFLDPTKTGQEAFVGADIELGKYIAEKLGVSLVIEAMDFSAVLAAISQGKADIAISGFAYTEERAKSVLLSDFYGMDEDSRQGILVRKDDKDSMSKAEDFAGKIIAAQNSSLQYNLLSSQLPDAVIEPISSLSDAILMLINGKVDGIAVSGDNGDAFSNNYDSVILSEFLFDYVSEGMVIGVSKGQESLLEEINKIIAEVNELGLYQIWRTEAVKLADSLGIND